MIFRGSLLYKIYLYPKMEFAWLSRRVEIISSPFSKICSGSKQASKLRLLEPILLKWKCPLKLRFDLSVTGCKIKQKDSLNVSLKVWAWNDLIWYLLTTMRQIMALPWKYLNTICSYVVSETINFFMVICFSIWETWTDKINFWWQMFKNF